MLAWPKLSGSGHVGRIVAPRDGRCFAFGAAAPDAANLRLVLGEGEVDSGSLLRCLTSNGLRDHTPSVAIFEG